jgi:hypothetical protein
VIWFRRGFIDQPCECEAKGSAQNECQYQFDTKHDLWFPSKAKIVLPHEKSEVSVNGPPSWDKFEIA